MAIIDCPNCRKKVSDKAKECSHCHVDIQNLDKEKLQGIKKVAKINKSQSLMNHSFIAMLLFCGGVLMLYWRSDEPESIAYITALTATVVGFLLYILTRIRILLLKMDK